jgi:preprotein translocase subunit Sss1
MTTPLERLEVSNITLINLPLLGLVAWLIKIGCIPLIFTCIY